MDFFPAFLRLEGETALVVGGGTVAARKAAALARCGAHVQIVAPVMGQALRESVTEGRATHGARLFSPGLLDGVSVVIAATDDRKLNARVASACRERGLPVNVVDDPALCSFITPAVVDRSPLVVAISSGGTAPVLARYWRARIERLIPRATSRLAAMAGAFRGRVKEALPDAAARLRFWEAAFEGSPATRALGGDSDGARQALERLLDHQVGGAAPQGEVYLVGAGPGDPELLTLKALRLMQQCDVVLHDRLVSADILDLVRRDAERVFVGKQRHCHAMPQQQINDLMVCLARSGKRVLRLKGGDPFIFGRGGEELAHLARHGIDCEVVPGVTAAAGCAAYAGIPLTHRDLAQSCVFVTGHRSRDGALDLDWPALARRGQTVVFYMGLHALGDICSYMIAGGLPGHYPAAVVQDGTCETQRVVVADLATLPATCAREGIRAPALVIVGEVVRLRKASRAVAAPGARGAGAELKQAAEA